MSKTNDGGYEANPDSFEETSTDEQSVGQTSAGEQSTGEQSDDKTIVVLQPDDETIVVVPAHDETIVVVPAHDETIAVPIDDETIVVPAVPKDPAPNDPAPKDSASKAAPKSGASNDESLKQTALSDGSATSHETTGTGGDPVVIAGAEVPAGLAKLLFKKPLDPKRRAPAAPFPQAQSSLPRGGVRSGIPVVYGTNPSEQVTKQEGTDFSRWIGPPPMGYELPVADREALPSSTLANRRFRTIAFAGGATVVVVAAVGLWWVIGELVM